MPVDRTRLKERAFERRWARSGKDRCNIIGPTFTDGGASGDSVSLGETATGLEVLIEELSPASSQTVVGGETYVSSHSLEMKRTAATDAIAPRHRIKVHARDGKGERFFEKPIASEASWAPLLVFKASLVRQGYQQ